MRQSKNDAVAKLLGSLGLCARARALTFGTSMICEAMRTAHPPRMVLMSSDVSAGTQKKLNDKCQYYHVTLVTLPVTGAELATAVGKSATLAAVALSDDNFCRLIQTQLQAIASQQKPLHETSTT